MIFLLRYLYLLYVVAIFHGLSVFVSGGSIGTHEDIYLREEINTINNTAEVLIGEDLFEGDLKIPKELILTNYDFSVPGGKELFERLIARNNKNVSAPGTKHRGAVDVDGQYVKLWKYSILPYRFSPDISENRRKEIRKAMDIWEKHTCVRFVLDRENNDDHVYFTSDDGSCFSSIGRLGGRQYTNLPPRCILGLILHELGHVIGFWHEQSRPDRDNYIILHGENFADRNGFLRLDSFMVDYQGSPYDYASIMHYPNNWGGRVGCRGQECITIFIKNVTEYRRQGSPQLGNFDRLSFEDIKQTNRLYSCPQKGIRGFLSIQVKQGYSLRDTDGLWNDPDPYVRITVVDSKGTNHIQRTSYKMDTRDPIWNELILLGENEWQFFRINTWDHDTKEDQQLTMSETIPVDSGSYIDLKNCENVSCNGYVIFDYNLDPRITIIARLSVYIRSAYHLGSTDEAGNGPDAYVHIEAIQSNAVKESHRSKTIHNSKSPKWDVWLDCGCKRWNSFFIEVMDENTGIDDRLSDRQWVLAYTGIHTHQTHGTYGNGNGHLTYDYRLVVDKHDCI